MLGGRRVRAMVPLPGREGEVVKGEVAMEDVGLGAHGVEEALRRWYMSAVNCN